MFYKLFAFLASWFDKALRLVQQGQAFGFWVLSGIAGIMIVWISVATYVVNMVNRLLLYLVGYFDSLRMSSDIVAGVQGSTTSFFSMLQLANTFFPVTEMFSIMVSIAIISGTCAVYGLVKSWIPTLSG